MQSNNLVLPTTRKPETSISGLESKERHVALLRVLWCRSHWQILEITPPQEQSERVINYSTPESRHMMERQCSGLGLNRKHKSAWVQLIVVLGFCAGYTRAAFVPFENCLQNSIVDSNPRLLQFVPLNVSATFDSASRRHNLSVTVYGNVTGKATDQEYPPPDDPSWSDPNSTFGKIVDLGAGDSLYTTLFTRYNVLSYTPYNAAPARFCDATVNEECPLGPAFYVNKSDLANLPGFTVAHDMYSSYAFTSITATMRIQSGDEDAQYYACVAATITPDLGSYLNGLLRYLPLAVLILVGLATIVAANLSPWGSLDLFHWSSNFGRDEDLLRLVTPGFGDCLQYIQFVLLTGSLSLNYPGFYQPVVTRVGWSSLMFNQSLVSDGNGTQTVVDGLYQYRNNSAYGLDRTSQLVGMTSPRDIWVDMMIWLVVIIAAVVILTQVGFAVRWLYRQVAHVPAEDLRSKNGPFTVGNVVRIALNYFMLPLISLSMFQLLIAGQGPTYSVALSVVVLLAIIAFSARLVFLFVRIRPRSFLFDDLQTVLTYGPLYNTYCDDAATFALVPIFVNLLRGIAIGAVQPSGVAQVVLLAICEIILILTINAFRPYPSATSMNVYHTCFAVVRLVTILLSTAFVPSIEVGAATRGWIGYSILLIHACVLIFGFFLNAIQTLIEVIARLAGAGGQGELAGGGPARGGLSKVFGVRQLSKRLPRRDKDNNSRLSMASSAAMLTMMENEQKDLQMGKSRSRSISASSAMLLDGNRNAPRTSQNYDGTSAGHVTPDAASTFSKRLTGRLSGSSAGGILGLSKQPEAKDPYYRPPRRNTMEPLGPSDKKPRASFTSADWARSAKGLPNDEEALDDAGEGSSTPVRVPKDDFEDVTNDLSLTKSKTDYAVREVDFYYGVRGPALSSGTRKLKTGPADPTGPVSSATGWFKGIFGGKTKEKGKGFEVVRSARAPPPGLMPPTPEPARRSPETYRDEPVSLEASRHEPSREVDVTTPAPTRADWEEESVEAYSDDEPVSPMPRVAARPPSLPLIDSVGAIELPSRIGSEASRRSKGNYPRGSVRDIPAVPRRSSRRTLSKDAAEIAAGLPKARLAPVTASPPSSPSNKQRNSNLTASGSGRIPFSSTQISPAKTNRYSTGAESTVSSFMHGEDEENQPPEVAYTSHLRHSSSALGHHAPDLRNDRPSSMGFVQQHRASDNIHQSPDSAEFEGTAAEIHGRPPRR